MGAPKRYSHVSFGGDDEESLLSDSFVMPPFTKWIRSIFTLPDDEIKAKCGEDALQYLRYMVYLTAILRRL